MVKTVNFAIPLNEALGKEESKNNYLVSYKPNSSLARFRIDVTRAKNSGSPSFISSRLLDSCSSA